MAEEVREPIRDQEVREIVKSVIAEFAGVKTLEARVNELVGKTTRLGRRRKRRREARLSGRSYTGSG